MRERDNQRQRVYDAERESLGRQFNADMTIEECAAFLAEVQRRPWFRTRWGNMSIGLVATNGWGARAYDSGEIRLGAGSRNRWVALHELAHTLTPYGCAGHGPEYVGVYLFLVERVLGKEAAQGFRESLRKHRARKTNKAIPKPTKRDATVSARKVKIVEAKRQPLTMNEWEALNRLLDRAIKSDALGKTNTAARKRALAVGREVSGKTMPKAAAGPVRIRKRTRRW